MQSPSTDKVDGVWVAKNYCMANRNGHRLTAVTSVTCMDITLGVGQATTEWACTLWNSLRIKRMFSSDLAFGRSIWV